LKAEDFLFFSFLNDFFYSGRRDWIQTFSPGFGIDIKNATLLFNRLASPAFPFLDFILVPV